MLKHLNIANSDLNIPQRLSLCTCVAERLGWRVQRLHILMKCIVLLEKIEQNNIGQLSASGRTA